MAEQEAAITAAAPKKIIVPPAAANGMQYCSKCNKTMAAVNFYTYKDGTKCELCKACLTMHINNWQEDTYLWILEKFDVPYVKAEWDVLRDRAYQKDPYKMTGMSVIGKYLSKMRLKNWKNYGWADTEMFKKKAEEDAENLVNPNAQTEEDLCKMKEAYENGEISEAQFKTYEKMNSQPECGFGLDPTKGLKDQRGGPGSGYGNPYPVNDHPYAEVELPDIGADLTEDDKKELAMRWGLYYTPAQWVALDLMYNQFLESFDIQGAARLDTLKMICKTSLKMNEAIDSGDVDSYQKYSKVYDALMKSAKFTEAQRKEEKTDSFDSVGQIVYFAEKVGGKIKRHDISTTKDVIDEKIDQLKKYTKELIMNDPALAQDIENYMRNKNSFAEAEAEREKALAAGEEEVILKDEDYEEYNKFIEEEKSSDEEVEDES